MTQFLHQIVVRLYRYRVPILLAVHALLIVGANQTAFLLRFDGIVPPPQQPYYLSLLPLLVAIRLGVFIPLRLQRGVWRYASIWDLRNILLGVGLSSLAFWIVVHGVLDISVYPRSVMIIDTVFLICLMGGLRLARRLFAASSRPGGRKVLIYGAGNAGEMVVRDMIQSPGYEARPIGFVDDDPRKHGQSIHGVPVLGSREDLERIVTAKSPDEVLIAIPSVSPLALRAIVRRLQPFKVRINTLPRLSDLIGGRVSVRQIRQLKLEDLLAREPVALDAAPIREVLTGKRVLVTGAGGSIGSELCRQILGNAPETLLLLDRYENSLFAVHHELAAREAGVGLRCVVADITDERRIDQVLSTYRPHVIFHAAAHKHVPLMEENPGEAVKNNIGGTRVVAEAAQRHGVDRFVLISTDKAVNPTSVMGAAKRVTELFVQSLDTGETHTRFVVVRFGNVLGSNGSVVPRFIEQIDAGGPVTVTHPEMRRYFMLIPEAVQLVLHAATIDDRDAIFVLDMGEQVRVVDMARDLIRLSGYVPDREIEIVFSGVRPGEKLFEELIGEGESAGPSGIPKIIRVTSSGSRLSLRSSIASLEEAAEAGQDDVVIERLGRIVPSFTPQPQTRSLPRVS